MRVLLLNDGGFGDADDVKFPVEVEALRLTGDGFFLISRDELHRVGFVGFDGQKEWYFGDGGEAVLADSKPEPVDTPCDITNKCCNQFGERDEIQAIIDKLHADVAERDERIKVLEQALDNTNDELHKTIVEVNHHLEHNICSTDLDDPDYWDFQTCYENAVLLGLTRDEKL